MKYIGASAARREDARLLTGRGRYVGDVRLPGLLEAVFVRSVHPHATVGSIVTDRALALSGVFGVLCASDLPAATLASKRHPELLETPQPVLAGERVRFVGEAVAIVLAEDRYVAEDAADLVDVEYSTLPAVVEPGTTFPPLHAEVDANVVFIDAQIYGDPNTAFARAAHVFSRDLNMPRLSASPLEARGCVARFDPASRLLTVWSSTQAPHRLRRDLAAACDMPENGIRVVMHDVGGAFGQKIPTHLEELAVVLASMHVGRPVRWIEDRRENLISAPHSRDQSVHLELALDDDLLFTGLRAKILGDAGAYSFNSGSCLTEAYRTARSLPGPYKVPHFQYDVTIGLTNKSPIAPYRGVGQVAAQCVRELLIEKAARALRVNTVDLRRRNLVSTSDMPYTTATGWVFRGNTFIETLDMTEREMAGSDGSTEGASWVRGVGYSVYAEPGGLGSEGGLQLHGFPSPSHDAARITLDTSGKATVHVGTPSVGQGLETTMAQVAAEILGMRLDDVAVAWTDTSQAPLSLTGTRASRAAVVSGGAVALAAEDVRQQVLRVAAHMLEANPDDLSIHEGAIYVVGEQDPRVALESVVAEGFSRQWEPGEECTFEATRAYDPPATYSNACVAAEVLVDTRTGSVRVRRLVAAEDCGQMINPKIVEGQFAGAAAQALGSVLFERLHYDEEGQPLVSTFMDYLLPTANDVAFPELHHSPRSGGGWRDVRGVGESGVIGATAAIACAIDNAVSHARVEHEWTLPALPESVWRALREDGQ